MDVLNELKENKDELLDTDLDFYITELETGNYSQSYIAECMDIINSIRESKIQSKDIDIKFSDFSNARIDPKQLIPDYEDDTKPLSPEEVLWKTISSIRKDVKPLEKFRKYFESEPLMTEQFIDDNFKKFYDDEIGTILENKNMSEEFLEKYFAELDKAKISHYQKFSEEFFMKHFKNLNVSTVLTKGPNEWRKKANRSQKLNVFLKLKGVNL